MRFLKWFFYTAGWLFLVSCSAVKTPVSHQYTLSSFSAKALVAKPRPVTILVSTPEALGGYQTEQMLYTNKPFQIDPFANNAWVNPPAEMLYPLIVQSIQRTNYFYAVASSPYNGLADYRLDTQLLTLKQNFLKKPSVLEFTLKVVLTQVEDNKVLASRLINLEIPCTMDTPYGGVIAANEASYQATAMIASFVLGHMAR